MPALLIQFAAFTKLQQFAAYGKLIVVLYVRVCCHSYETRTPLAKLPNSAQLDGTPTIPQSYIRLRGVM